MSRDFPITRWSNNLSDVTLGDDGFKPELPIFTETFNFNCATRRTWAVYRQPNAIIVMSLR